MFVTPTYVRAQDCSGNGGGDPSQNDAMNPGGGGIQDAGGNNDMGDAPSSDNGTQYSGSNTDDSGTVNTPQQADTLNSGGSVDGGVSLRDGSGSDASSGGSSVPDPINVTISANARSYAESPTMFYPAPGLFPRRSACTRLNISIPTVPAADSDHRSVAAGVSDPRSVGVTFPSPGTYLVRAAPAPTAATAGPIAIK